MAYQVGYLTELSGLKFDEAEGDTMTSTFMAMPYGEYKHPVYGEINFDLRKAQEAESHIKNHSRGTDLDIDFDHKQYSGEAAGWVKGAEARQDGLYLTVDWTKKAWEAIKSKAYRYFSPEFADEWTHPKTNVTHKNILFGGGITNRPFLKDILPLNMSELSLAEEQVQPKEGKGMDPKKLRKLLGLPEDATDEAVAAAMEALPDDASISTAPVEVEEKPKVENQEGTDAIAASGDFATVIKTLSESSNVEVKALAEVMGGLVKTIHVQGEALKLAETTMQVKKLMEPVEGRALPAGVKQLLSDALATPSTDSVFKLVEALNKTGHVALGEHEVVRREGEANDSTKKFNELVEAAMTADKSLSYGDAVEAVAMKHQDLFEGHRQSAYAFKEN